MIIILGICVVCYVLLILTLFWGFQRVPYFSLTSKTPETFFSIVIPFRNEAKNLPALLSSLQNLNYPSEMYEVLLINDASEDHSVAIIDSFIKKHPETAISISNNVRQSGSPKKDAIVTAIKKTTHPWILTTDADCTTHTQWLKTLDCYIQKHNPKLIVGPIDIVQNKRSFLNSYEFLDIASLLGATLGGFGIKRPFLCNGANLAYRKDTFLALDGFSGNDHMASGDDIFLLEKYAKAYPEDVHYLKTTQALVTTQNAANWTSFISQRVRWAAKSTSYTNPFAKMVGITVLLGNISLIFGIGLFWSEYAFPSGSWTGAKAESLPLIVLFIGLKIFADVLLIYSSASFLGKKSQFVWYPLSAIIYPFLSTYIAIKALTSSFTWKDRTYTK